MFGVNNELVKKYLEIYFQSSDTDIKMNEKKKVRNLLTKLNDPNSVFRGLSFECLSIMEQVKLLHFILEEIEERQIVSNLSKADADKDYSNIEISGEKTEGFTRTFFKDEMLDYATIDINNELISSRQIIRSERDMQALLDYLNQSNEKIIRCLINESNAFYVTGVHFENLDYIKSYIDYVINDILQLVVYKIIPNSEIDTLAILQKLSTETKKLSSEIDIQLIRKREEQKKKNDLTARRIMLYFSAYLKHRSKLKEEIEIYTKLKEEAKQVTTLFNNVPKEYQAAKVILSEEEIKGAKVIITEGENVPKFEEKMANVRMFIDIMRIYGGRQCYSNCLQDLKVYFREIYMSKVTHKRQQTRKIVEDYIEKVEFALTNNEPIPEFNMHSQYMFVREKISRGYFREKGLLPEYFEKVEFTNEFYNLLLKIYWFCDFEDSLELIYKVNYHLLKVFSTLIEA